MLRWVPGPKGSHRASVEASGLSDPAQLKVFAGEQRETAMAGSIEKQGALVVFVPRFPLLPGTTYYALCGTVSVSFRLPSPAPSTPTRVLQVYPSASTLSSSKPMARSLTCRFWSSPRSCGARSRRASPCSLIQGVSSGV